MSSHDANVMMVTCDVMMASAFAVTITSSVVRMKNSTPVPPALRNHVPKVKCAPIVDLIKPIVVWKRTHVSARMVLRVMNRAIVSIAESAPMAQRHVAVMRNGTSVPFVTSWSVVEEQQWCVINRHVLKKDHLNPNVALVKRVASVNMD
jgi:hypothetical protein